MTITWLNQDRVGQKSQISTLLSKLYNGQDLTIPATYIGAGEPTSDDFKYAWSNKVGYTAQPIEGSPVQWFDPDNGIIRDHYSKVPEDNIVSSGSYHQHGYIDPKPWSKLIKVIHADGTSVGYDVGNEKLDFPLDYRDLLIFGNVRSTVSAAATAVDMSVIKFGVNSNTHTTHYASQQGTGAATQGNVTLTSMIARGGVPKSTTRMYGGFRIKIPDYAGLRDGRSIWLAWQSRGFSPLDDASAADDLRLSYSGGRTGVVGVIGTDGIRVFAYDGVALAKGSWIAVAAINPIL